MPRKKGDRNAAFEDARGAILDRLTPLLASGAGADAGLRILANAAEVSVSTLVHYFGDRAGIISAAFGRIGENGRVHLDVVRRPTGPFEKSVRDLVQYWLYGFTFAPVVEAHVLGLREGPRTDWHGRAYVEEILEPMLQATEDRLREHITAGEMKRGSARTAALALFSPIFMAHMHQGPLSGAHSRPLDLQAMADEHVAAFVRAYATKRRTASAQPPLSALDI